MKDLFGAPGTGVHSWRIADIAVVDTAMTVIAAWLFSKWAHKPFLTVFLILFLIGEIMHLVFCVDTKVVKLLSGSA